MDRQTSGIRELGSLADQGAGKGISKVFQTAAAQQVKLPLATRFNKENDGWQAAIDRGLIALEHLSVLGSDTARFLKFVLVSLGQIAKNQPENTGQTVLKDWGQSCWSLRKAVESVRRRNVIYSRNLSCGEEEFLLLRRAVLDLQALLGKGTSYDLSKVKDLQNLRQGVLDALMSILCAENQVQWHTERQSQQLMNAI